MRAAMRSSPLLRPPRSMPNVTARGQAHNACDAQDTLHVLHPIANAAERRAMTQAKRARKRG